MTLLELSVTAGIVAAALVAGAAHWQDERKRAGVLADLKGAQDLAAEYQRDHACWTATGAQGAAAMMAATGRNVQLADPAAWSASFGTRVVSRLGVAPGVTDPAYMTMRRTRQWMAIHFTSADADLRAALEGEGGAATGPATVTVEVPRREPLSAGRGLMMGVREGPGGC